MKNEHIPFTMLSDLHDNILPDSERAELESHLKECPHCLKEYQDLNKLINMVSYLRFMKIKSGDEFVHSTLYLIRRRRKLYYYKRIIPTAAAAVIFFIVGVGYFNSVPVYENGNKAFNYHTNAPAHTAGAGHFFRDLKEISSLYDIKNTLSILRKNSAHVVLVSDSYIEGDVPVYVFDNMSKEFDTSSRQNSSFGMATQVNFSDGETRTDDMVSLTDVISPPKTNNTVRFRVLLK